MNFEFLKKYGRVFFSYFFEICISNCFCNDPSRVIERKSAWLQKGFEVSSIRVRKE